MSNNTNDTVLNIYKRIKQHHQQSSIAKISDAFLDRQSNMVVVFCNRKSIYDMLELKKKTVFD